jgi:hypothetical protein
MIKSRRGILAGSLWVLLNTVMAAHLVWEGIKPDTSNILAPILDLILDTGCMRSFESFVRQYFVEDSSRMGE